MSFIEVEVEWSEEWDRKATTKIDEAEIREWANLPEGDIPERTIISFLESDGENSWHPNTVPDGRDDWFSDATIHRARIKS